MFRLKYLRSIVICLVCATILLCPPSLVTAEELEDKPDNNKASGQASSYVNGNGVVAISNGAEIVEGDNNVAVGYSKQTIMTTGKQRYSKGYPGSQNKSQPIDPPASYIAFGAYADGENNTAIGNAYQIIGTGSFCPDGLPLDRDQYNNTWARGAEAIGAGNTAIGTGAKAHGYSNTAIGYNAYASHDQSVALGAGSVTDRSNSVSVGNAESGLYRQITNVAPGTYATDAVNMSQLWSVENKVRNVGAMAFAMSALAPLPYDPKEPTQIAAGIGTYDGNNAIALGVFHYSGPSKMYNAAIAISDDGWEKSARFGITWRTGGSKPEVITPAAAPIETQDEDNIVNRVKRILAGQD